MVANVVILGAMAEGTGMVDMGLLKTCLQESVPPGTEQLNLKALEAGRLLYAKTIKAT
jgi:2-oxoglutarate ferredoxin oxidoreductase subunit gamma